jgi:hypothetical protein
MAPQNSKIPLELPPVGIQILSDTLHGYEQVERFKGISYCQAIFHATYGQQLILEPGSIQVCQWSPIVLGLKEPENDFEKSIDIHLPAKTAGIYLAPVFDFTEKSPDIVIIRTNSNSMKEIIKTSGLDSFIPFKDYQSDQTALHTLAEGNSRAGSLWLIRNVNSLLDFLNRFKIWQRTTSFLFRSTTLTRVFDAFISRFMANMSMCRNSTVIPFQTGRANISFFCTGGIAWGMNSAKNMTSGYTWSIFQELEPYLDYPGKRANDPRIKELQRERNRLLSQKKGSQGCPG